MKCKEFEFVAVELAREELMEVAVRDEALAHLDSCQSCAARLEEQRALTASLRELSLSTSAVSVSPSIERSLVAEFKQHQKERTMPASRGSYARQAMYAAAVMMIAVALGVVYLTSGGEQNGAIGQRVLTGVAAESVPVDAAIVLNPTASDTPKVEIHKQRRLKPRRRTVNRVNNSETLAANYLQTEVASDFIPISYQAATNVEEGAQLLRVEMPRSAMVRFGFPVNIERYNERVKADVLVGADGFARAIRFVQ